MSQITARNIDVVWVLLMLATVASGLIVFAGASGAVDARAAANAWILLMAGAKIWLVMDWFMELRTASGRVRLAARLWLSLLLLGLLWLVT